MESPAAALRRHQTEVRRLLRGGFTKCALLRTAHAAWREEGKDILTELANAALLRDQGPSHPLPEHLSALPDLEARVLDKRRESLAAAIARLRASRDPSNRDTRAAAVVAAAAAASASAKEAEIALAAAADVDALRDRVDDPVFETLSAPKLLHALNDAIRMFTDDVEVKSAILEEVERAATSATTTRKEKDGEDEGTRLSRETLTTCIATWILSPMLDEEALAEMEVVVAMETK